MSSAPVEEEETQTMGAIAAVLDPEVDSQVMTARRFPRSITSFMRRAKEMATLTPDIAASCIYALPRKENGKQKNIEGPSARFSEICASAWGNIRAEGKVLGHDDQFVTARGTTWDVESNVAIAFEVKRRITDREGRLFNADMIGVTGNASASIALRNSILKVIPTPFWKPIYLECRKVVAGDVRTFASRRDNMFHEFAVMGVTAERLTTALGVKGKDDVTLDHMATLGGFFTALKEGDTTIEEAFPESGGLGTPKPAERKSQQAPAATTTAPVAPAGDANNRSGAEARSREMPSAATGTVGGPASPAVAVSTRPVVSPIGVVVDVLQRGTSALVKLDTKFQAATKDAALIRGAEMLKASGQRVELVTKPSSDPTKYAANLVELKPIEDGASA